MKPLLPAIWLMVACTGGTPSSSEGTTSARAPGATPGARLVVATYNVNFGTAGAPDIVDAIRQTGADVVFLQETNRAWQTAIDSELDELYPVRLFRHSRRAGGQAVLSRFPVTDLEQITPEAARFPAWLVEVDSPVGPLRVINLHLHPVRFGNGSRLAAYARACEIHERELAGVEGWLDGARPTLLVGDFNEDAVTGGAARRLRQLGYESVLTTHALGEPTWRWRTRMGRVSWQLDHIFVGPGLTSLDARVMTAGSSDHVPVVATITAGPQRRTAGP